MRPSLLVKTMPVRESVASEELRDLAERLEARSARIFGADYRQCRHAEPLYTAAVQTIGPTALCDGASCRLGAGRLGYRDLS
jgi:hypothetical protein